MDRQQAKTYISKFVKKSNNVNRLEHYINKYSSNEEDYKRILYNVLYDLEYDKNLKEIANELKLGHVKWNNKIYDNIKSKLEEHDQYIINPIEVVEGVIQCPKCKGNRTWSTQKQTRSQDEPMTTFSKCANCQHTWSYSG